MCELPNNEPAALIPASIRDTVRNTLEDGFTGGNFPDWVFPRPPNTSLDELVDKQRGQTDSFTFKIFKNDNVMTAHYDPIAPPEPIQNVIINELLDERYQQNYKLTVWFEDKDTWETIKHMKLHVHQYRTPL